jgi:chromosome segregation ATPase
MSDDLKPCPFCTEGKSVSTYFDHEQCDKWGYAACDACVSRGPEVRTGYDPADDAPWQAEAIAAWNTRTPDPSIEALTEQLEAARADAKEAEAYAEELEKERERLALAICGGEDAPGYANAQTVETLEKVARDNANATMEQINLTLDVEAKLSRAVDVLSECLERNALLEAKLAECEARLGKAMEGLREIAGECGCSTARAIIAEIEGDQP